MLKCSFLVALLGCVASCAQPISLATTESPPTVATQPDIKMPTVDIEGLGGAYITATRTNTAAEGQWIYRMELWEPDGDVIELQAISGRPQSQLADVHIPNTGAPLPPGLYSLGAAERVDNPVELGGMWIGAEPLFETGRSALGIHYDPSFGLTNGESGTEGCLAVMSEADREVLWRYAVQHQPRFLIVR